MSLRHPQQKEFVDFLITDDAKEIFQKYYFDTDVED